MSNSFYDLHWYKDIMRVKRLVEITVGNVKKKEYQTIYNKVKCKMYTTAQATLDTTQTSGVVQETNSLVYNNKYKLQAGDEIILWQYGIDYDDETKGERYIVGKPKVYKEPYGGVRPGLEHTQVQITLKTRTTNKL